MRRLVLPLLVAAACAPSNDRVLDHLERTAAREPRPAYDALLDAPPGAVPLQGPARAVTLPMIQGRVPTVLGRVNGVEMPIVLDTGTSHVMVSGAAARDARVYVSDQEAVGIVRPGHVDEHRTCVFASLELGGNRFGPGVATVPVRPMSMPHWADLPSQSYAIAGCAVLSHFRVTFDFVRREVSLVPHGRPPSIDLVHAPVEINGRAFYLMVDSGAIDLVLEPWAAARLGLISARRLELHRKEARKEADVVYSRVTLETVQVRGRVFFDVRALSVRTFGEEAEQGLVMAGLLGLQAFGPRVWTVDYGRRRLLPE